MNPTAIANALAAAKNVYTDFDVVEVIPSRFGDHIVHVTVRSNLGGSARFITADSKQVAVSNVNYMAANTAFISRHSTCIAGYLLVADL